MSPCLAARWSSRRQYARPSACRSFLVQVDLLASSEVFFPIWDPLGAQAPPLAVTLGSTARWQEVGIRHSSARRNLADAMSDSEYRRVQGAKLEKCGAPANFPACIACMRTARFEGTDLQLVQCQCIGTPRAVIRKESAAALSAKKRPEKDHHHRDVLHVDHAQGE